MADSPRGVPSKREETWSFWTETLSEPKAPLPLFRVLHVLDRFKVDASTRDASAEAKASVVSPSKRQESEQPVEATSSPSLLARFLSAASMAAGLLTGALVQPVEARIPVLKEPRVQN